MATSDVTDFEVLSNDNADDWFLGLLYDAESLAELLTVQLQPVPQQYHEDSAIVFQWLFAFSPARLLHNGH